MTNGWIDIKNTDMMLIMGGNPAENHPCGFKWAIEAKIHRNAKTIVVDPRLTRTAATADMYLQIRAGADIAFLGGLIHYAVENNRIAHDYLVNYTNAAFIIKEGFKLPDDGLYSGFDAEKKVYDKSSWNYEEGGDLAGKPVSAGVTPPALAAKPAAAGTTPAPPPALPPKIAYDLSLQHPRCVFQLLKKQYERYTPEMVERITGNSEGSIPEGGGSVYVRPQRWRYEKSRHDYLCRRLDPAQLRHADHPHRGHAAVAHGKRGSGWRWC
jgi:formate dehydrogenase major subunit